MPRDFHPAVANWFGRTFATPTPAQAAAWPAIAAQRGWAHAGQGGPGKAVFCCHVEVAQKHWLFPAEAVGASAIPMEFAFGPLKVNPGQSGCDLRPSDPRRAAAEPAKACCGVKAQPAAATVP